MTRLLRSRLFWLILLCWLLLSCAKTEPVIIETNRFIQTDYNYNCLEGDKTFSEIILCYQTQDRAEKQQNAITNALIKDKED